MVQWLTNPTRIHEDVGSLSGLRSRHCRELWCRSQTSSDSALLWLWHKHTATALIQPLAREPPYATGAAQENGKKAKKKKRKKKETGWLPGHSIISSPEEAILVMVPYQWARSVPHHHTQQVGDALIAIKRIPAVGYSVLNSWNSCCGSATSSLGTSVCPRVWP